jgi:hypothetical protein
MEAAVVILDHVIIATTDLAQSADQLAESTGLVAVEGGPHDGLGTYNYIVPLGRGYLELVAVIDRDIAQRNDFGRLVLSALEHRSEAFAGWAVSVTAHELKAHADSYKMSIGRLTRRGLGVDHVGMTRTTASPGLPFLLSRRAEDPHPQTMPALHREQPRAVHSLTIDETQADLQQWLSGLSGGTGELSVVCRGRGRGIVALEIPTDEGMVILADIDPTRGAQR